MTNPKNLYPANVASEVTPPKPLEQPQEIELCPECDSSSKGIRDLVPDITEYVTCSNGWHEPKPAPQAEGPKCSECDGPMEWELMCAHCGSSTPMAEGFQAWFETQACEGDEDYPSPEEIGFAQASWSAAQAPLLQKIAELEAEVKVLRGALIYIGRKVGCLLSDEVSTGFIATGVPDEVTAKIAELEEKLREVGK